jgi:hypothetical protein
MSNKHYTCPFSHLILSGRCGCKFSAKDCIAEKEFGTCLNESASNDYQSLYQQLRNNSNFARGLCINMNNHQESTFYPLGIFLNIVLVLLEQGLNKLLIG